MGDPLVIQHIAGEGAVTMAACVAIAVILLHRTRGGIRSATKVHAEGASSHRLMAATR